MKRSFGLLGVLALVVSCGGAQPNGSSATTTPADPTADPGASAAPTAEPAPSVPDVKPLDAYKAFAKEGDAAWAAHDVKRFQALYAAKAVVAEPGPAGWSEKPATEMGKELTALFKAFPDAKLTTTRIIANGSSAILEWTLTGTHKGEFMGAKPTGKPVGYRGASLVVVDNKGKVTSEHLYMDHATMMGQLGLGPKGQKVRPVQTAPAGALEVVAGKDGEGKANVEVLKKLYAAGEKLDVKAYGELLAKEFVLSNGYDPADQPRFVMLQQMPMMNKAFPDPKWSVKTCVAAGDLAACEIEWTATWKAPAMGMKATGKTGTVHALEIAQIKDGKLLHLTGYGSGAEFAHAFGIGAEPPKDAGKDKPKDAGKDKPKDAGKDTPKDAGKDKPKG